MADGVRVNAAEMRALLDDPTGPVVGELRNLAKTVERGAKRRSKGRIAAGVEAKQPVKDGRGWYADVETGAEDEHGAPIGLFTEVGTKPHVIEPKDKQALAWPGAGHPVKRVNHPGTKPQPHLRPALYEDIR